MSAGSGPMRRGFWLARADELDRARERGEIGDDAWFAGMAEIFETAYLEGKNPRAQSGFGGDPARWETARRPIADVIDRAGSFLDVGCASGHLLESVVRWSRIVSSRTGSSFRPASRSLRAGACRNGPTGSSSATP